MGHDVLLESLRRAAGDPDALGRVLAEDLPGDALQHIGDAALTVLELPGDLTDAVDRLVDQLRQRQWDGDDELADALEHVIGRRASSLQPLPVELADLGEALSEQDGTENYLDLHTGTVWLHTMTDFGVADDLDIDFSDDTRWLFVLGEGSHEAYRDLRRFIGTVDDDDLATQLSVAIEGRGAFGRFRSDARTRPRRVHTLAPLRCRRAARTRAQLARRPRLPSPTRPPRRPRITAPELTGHSAPLRSCGPPSRRLVRRTPLCEGCQASLERRSAKGSSIRSS